MRTASLRQDITEIALAQTSGLGSMVGDWL